MRGGNWGIGGVGSTSYTFGYPTSVRVHWRQTKNDQMIESSGIRIHKKNYGY